METAITHGIEVSVETFYQEQQSHPVQDSFMFAYRITLHNRNAQVVQLMRRNWIITNGFGDVKQMSGDGVVGRQPIIYPGDQHQYVSGCHLDTAIGTMFGTYTFVNKETGKEFDVRIPVFKLEAPVLLN